jgi:hypothetical protein
MLAAAVTPPRTPGQATAGWSPRGHPTPRGQYDGVMRRVACVLAKAARDRRDAGRRPITSVTAGIALLTMVVAGTGLLSVRRIVATAAQRRAHTPAAVKDEDP